MSWPARILLSNCASVLSSTRIDGSMSASTWCRETRSNDSNGRVDEVERQERCAGMKKDVRLMYECCPTSTLRARTDQSFVKSVGWEGTPTCVPRVTRLVCDVPDTWWARCAGATDSTWDDARTPRGVFTIAVTMQQGTQPSTSLALRGACPTAAIRGVVTCGSSGLRRTGLPIASMTRRRIAAADDSSALPSTGFLSPHVTWENEMVSSAVACVK